MSNVVAQYGSAVPGDNGACGPLLDSGESWGPATAIVAEFRPWQPTTRRVIVPISDEGPCAGDPCETALNTADLDSIENAIDISNQNNVFCFPVVGQNPTNGPCVRTHAQLLADGTGGEWFDAGVTPYSVIDDLLVDAILDLVGTCEDPCACPADLAGPQGGPPDCTVGPNDLFFLLARWTAQCADCCTGSCEADIDDNCNVGITDLLALLPAWGPCPCPCESLGGPDAPDDAQALDAALASLGFGSLVEYEAWLWGASESEAVASAWALLEVFEGDGE